MVRAKPIGYSRFRWNKPLPYHERKQIFLPEFVIALIRTPHLPPRFAQFYVPLEFNKLDMRDYMKRVYGVDVLTIRSFVEQQKVTRERKFGRPGYGPLRRPKSKKKMTIEMTQPFVWPEPPKSDEDWNKKEFYDSEKYTSELQKEFSGQNATEAPESTRESYKKQAKDLLEGKAAWRPTWQALGLQYDRAALKKFAVKKGSEAGTKPAATVDATATSPTASLSNDSTSPKDSPSTHS
ncbi:hypothetical protein PISL3812_01305 [Talaromyces islandicus]|uniref:Large ribosomal subunit protein uL23m n=1 Tax=Talaromyces islandicus TaxID=28573 RepID=A0A0U1LLS7_TALIS|nr:hypothetical protein PISL3812_01305 [Talaromyces islandicus]